MDTKEFIIGYTLFGWSTLGEKTHLRLFKDGLSRVVKEDYINGEKVISEKNIGQEKLDEYVNKLVSMDFLNYQTLYKNLDMLDGKREELILNNNGLQKKVVFENKYPNSKGIKELIQDFSSLIE